MVADFRMLASHNHLNLLSKCGILRFRLNEFTMNILRRCEEIAEQPGTAEDRLQAVCMCLHNYGVQNRQEFMVVFDRIEEIFSDLDKNHLYKELMAAQMTYMEQQVQQNANIMSLVEEFYDDVLYEDPNVVWFERLQQWGILRPIRSQDFPQVFDNCQNTDKLAAVLSAGLMDVEDELFGAQSWLTTNLATSNNVFALRAFAKSLPGLLKPWEDDFCRTTQTLLEEMAQYGLYSCPHPRSEGDDFFCELLDHSSEFNQLLPEAARIDHHSLVQRLDLLLHDSLGPVLTNIIWPSVEHHTYPSVVVVQYLGAHLSDHWTNQDINHIPTFPSATSTEWEDIAFHHFLQPLSATERAQILYMALGRMRPQSSLMPPQNAPVAHLPWVDEAWELRRKSFAEDRWDEHKDNNLCNYIVASRSQNVCEQWISILLDGLKLEPVYFLDANHFHPAVESDVVCTPWPQQWVRNHPRVQHALLQRNILTEGVVAVKKM